MNKKAKRIIAGLLAITLIASVAVHAPVEAQPRSNISMKDVRTDKATLIASKTKPNCAWFVEAVAPAPQCAWFVEAVDQTAIPQTKLAANMKPSCAWFVEAVDQQDLRGLKLPE